MGARNNAISFKKSDANENLRCFLITVDKDGKNSSEKPDTCPKTSKDRLFISKSPPKIKPELKIPNVCMASLRQDSEETIDLDVGSGESRAALSMDKINMNIQGLDEIQNSGSPSRFITVCNRVLENRPSFLILKDASTRNQTKEDMDYCDLSQSESSLAQQKTFPAVISFCAGSQTDETCSQVDVASNNKNCHGENASTQCMEETQKEADSSSLQDKLKPHTPKIKQQQQQEHLISSTAPFVTISFTPLPQTGSSCGTSVAPCQQFPSAATSNASNCFFCTSNCCLPRPPQVCQMPKTTCCFPGLAAPPNLGSCLLTPNGYPYCCCSRSISCWPVFSPQNQSSLGFPGHCNRGGMVVSNQISHLFQPILSTTGFAPGGSFYSGINPCLGHCPMNVHHYPHCNCAGFLSNQQQHLLQMGRRSPLQMGQPYPLQMGHPYELQIGQLPQVGHHAHCVCSFKKQPKKAMGSEVSVEDGYNRDGSDNVVSKVSPTARIQPSFKEQDHQEQTAKGKCSTEGARAYGGATQVKRNFNSTAYYAARSGRTCLILRPTATAMVPRLLTRRISRYTSVIMAPK